MSKANDVVFSDAVKDIQKQRGSRNAYARVEFESEVTDDLARFLSSIDTAFVASVSGDGQPYIQHRGGPKGFLHAIDDHTIGFVDFAGNKQYVTTGNLTENDRVCIMAIDYARRRRVKIWGHARTVPATPELVAKLGDRNYRARVEQVVLVEVTAWDVNCPQHIPQKLDAEEVAERIRQLEEENAALRARLTP
jgi:predicted pyridoxine 5'-phosphate oxidase superfamily flavin-nucleotide-binding protein